MKTFLSLFAALTVSAFAQDQAPISVKLEDGSGGAIENAQVVAVLKNGAHQDAKFDKTDGTYKCIPPSQCIKIVAAAPGHESAIQKYSGAPGMTAVQLKASPDKNSTLSRGVARFPGIDGDVEPIKDSTNRTYMHANKISLEKQGRPSGSAKFEVGRPVNAFTNTGLKFKITVVEIMPQVMVLEYTTPK